MQISRGKLNAATPASERDAGTNATLTFPVRCSQFTWWLKRKTSANSHTHIAHRDNVRDNCGASLRCVSSRLVSSVCHLSISHSANVRCDNHTYHIIINYCKRSLPLMLSLISNEMKTLASSDAQIRDKLELCAFPNRILWLKNHDREKVCV